MFKRFLAGAAAAALALGLLAGCGGGTAQPSAPAEPASPLDDGVLRYLYDYTGAGGGTLLRGDEAVLQAAPSETISLLYSPESADPAGWMRGYNAEDGSRRTQVYDAAGKLLWEGAGTWRANLGYGLLSLQPETVIGEMYPDRTGCILIDTATGAQLPLPAEACGCIPLAGGQVMVTLLYDRESAAGADVVLMDTAGNELWRGEHAYGFQISGENAPVGCIYVECYDPVSEQWGDAMLYDPATGEWVEHYLDFCGERLLCCREGETGSYVRSLDSPTPLSPVYDGVVQYWREDGTALVRDQELNAYLHTPDGAAMPLFTNWAWTSSGDSAVFLLADGTLYFCLPDGQTASLEADLRGADYATVLVSPAGMALLSLSDPAGNSWYLLYSLDAVTEEDPSGLVYDSTGSGYSSISYLTEGPDGPLFAAGYPALANAYLTNVIDARGAILLEGLADVQSAGISTLPEGTFTARRGFERGIMDADGQWLYSESIFSALADEDNYSWY